MKRLTILLLFGLMSFGVWHFWWNAWPAEIYRFDDVSGPNTESRIAEPVATRVEDFDKGGPNRLAVLVTDPNSDWMGLVRGFKSHGIPATFTTDPNKALRHEVIIAYPGISGRLVSQDAIRGLAQHVRSGATLLTMDLAGGGLEELFGISAQVPSRERTMIRWARTSVPEDTFTRFSSARAEVKIGSLALTPTSAEVVARYEDGSAAAVCRRVGGKACILGVDLGSIAQRAMNGRSEAFSPDFVNTYQPGMDVLFRWVRDLYVEGEDQPYLIGTAPAGREGSIILTHDVDFTRSVGNSVVYAEAIGKRGLSATFMVQTKYVRDWNDEIFFNDVNVPAFKRLARTMEIGSHTVSHARGLKAFEVGTGQEEYPSYQPFVENQTQARNGTLFGEARVSKYLIERLVGAKVRSFRPGHLSYPQALPEVLDATGYRYASATTANSAQTHLPFQLSYARSGQGFVPVWEFPVTIEDEKSPRLGDRFDAAVRVIDRIARHGGVAVILIHPDVTGHKLQFEERLIDRMKSRMWIGSLGAFGDWWSARDRAEIDFDGTALRVRASTVLNEVVIKFPKSKRRSVTLKHLTGLRTIVLD